MVVMAAEKLEDFSYVYFTTIKKKGKEGEKVKEESKREKREVGREGKKVRNEKLMLLIKTYFPNLNVLMNSPATSKPLMFQINFVCHSL
jgi:hypothetical protein